MSPRMEVQQPNTFRDTLVCINLYSNVIRIHNCALIFPVTIPLRRAILVSICPCLGCQSSLLAQDHQLLQPWDFPSLLCFAGITAAEAASGSCCLVQGHWNTLVIFYTIYERTQLITHWFTNLSVGLFFKAASTNPFHDYEPSADLFFNFWQGVFHLPPGRRKAVSWKKTNQC